VAGFFIDRSNNEAVSMSWEETEYDGDAAGIGS
jgi:hypothetical protein